MSYQKGLEEDYTESRAIATAGSDVAVAVELGTLVKLGLAGLAVYYLAGKNKKKG